MTKDETLRLALEALENSWTEPNNEQYEIEKNAITAIKAALEAKDEPVVCSVCSEWEKVCDQHLRYINKLKKKRTWVGLTDENIEVLAKRHNGIFYDCDIDFARAIEAKLKEKNSLPSR